MRASSATPPMTSSGETSRCVAPVRESMSAMAGAVLRVEMRNAVHPDLKMPMTVQK